jgi:hypothetical protein
MSIAAKARTLASAVYDKIGDPRSKNALLFILLLMTAFGIVAPDTATSLRDTVIAMALH